MMRFRPLIVLLAFATACERGAATPPGRLSVPVAADHHVHILSPELLRDWRALGVAFSRPDSAYTAVTAAFGSHPAQGFLVSMAHMYGSIDFRTRLDLPLEVEHLRVRQANDHVAREVGRDPARFVGFCSVHLLRPYATAEIGRCRDGLGLAGLKLHLPAAGIDLTNSEHLHLLAAVSSRAARERRPLLIHLAPVDGVLRPEELVAFMDHVVGPNPELELYLAHLGGNGGYRVAAQRVVRAFTTYLHASEANSRRAIYFELSGALLARNTDGVPASRRSHARQLASDLRALGLERVVFGSDYPVFDPEGYARLLQARVPISSAEFAQIMGNRAPALVDAALRSGH